MTQKTDIQLAQDISNPNVGTRENKINWIAFLRARLLDIVDSKANKSEIAPKGDDGWAPILAVTIDGDRNVLQIADWAGGDGSKPATGAYIGASGLVTDVADGVNIRGRDGSAFGNVDGGTPGSVYPQSNFFNGGGP